MKFLTPDNPQLVLYTSSISKREDRREGKEKEIELVENERHEKVKGKLQVLPDEEKTEEVKHLMLTVCLHGNEKTGAPRNGNNKTTILS